MALGALGANGIRGIVGEWGEGHSGRMSFVIYTPHFARPHTVAAPHEKTFQSGVLISICFVLGGRRVACAQSMIKEGMHRETNPLSARSSFKYPSTLSLSIYP